MLTSSRIRKRMTAEPLRSSTPLHIFSNKRRRPSRVLASALGDDPVKKPVDNLGLVDDAPLRYGLPQTETFPKAAVVCGEFDQGLERVNTSPKRRSEKTSTDEPESAMQTPREVPQKRKTRVSQLDTSEYKAGDTKDPDAITTCKRRLTFSDADRVYELPAAASFDKDRIALLTVGQTVLRAARPCPAAVHDVARLSEFEQVLAWNEVASLASDPALADTYFESCIREATAEVFERFMSDDGASCATCVGSPRWTTSARVLDAAAAALAVAADAFAQASRARETDRMDRRLCESVLSSLANGSLRRVPGALESVACAAQALPWCGGTEKWSLKCGTNTEHIVDNNKPTSNRCTDLVISYRMRIMREMMQVVGDPDVDDFTWLATQRVLRVLIGPEVRSKRAAVIGQKLGDDASNTSPNDASSESSRDSSGDGSSDRAMELSTGDVCVLLSAIQRHGLASRNCTAVEEAFRAIDELARSSGETAAMLLVQDAGGVVRRVSRAYARDVGVQAAAVEALASIATPGVVHDVARHGIA